MKKTLFTIAVLLPVMLLSAPSFASVKGGALMDSSNSPVKATQDKCVTVSSGKFSSKCHVIKPKDVPKSS